MTLSLTWSSHGRAVVPLAAALALHAAAATALLWSPEPRTPPPTAASVTPITLVFLPPPAALETPADVADAATPAPAWTPPEIVAPPFILQSERAPDTVQERVLALPPMSDETRRVLQALAGCMRPDGTRRVGCLVTGALRTPGEVDAGFGLAGLSAAEIRALFEGAPLMPKAPDAPLDGARDRRLSGASEMRERLPPAHADPVFGD